jgi:hypothetical protein
MKANTRLVKVIATVLVAIVVSAYAVPYPWPGPACDYLRNVSEMRAGLTGTVGVSDGIWLGAHCWWQGTGP